MLYSLLSQLEIEAVFLHFSFLSLKHTSRNGFGRYATHDETKIYVLSQDGNLLLFRRRLYKKKAKIGLQISQNYKFNLKSGQGRLAQTSFSTLVMQVAPVFPLLTLTQKTPQKLQSPTQWSLFKIRFRSSYRLSSNCTKLLPDYVSFFLSNL